MLLFVIKLLHPFKHRLSGNIIKPFFPATLKKVYIHFERYHELVFNVPPAVHSHLASEMSMQLSAKSQHNAQAEHFEQTHPTEQAVYLLRSPLFKGDHHSALEMVKKSIACLTIYSLQL